MPLSTAMRATSLLAQKEREESGLNATQEEAVYLCLKTQGCHTDKELSVIMGIERSCINGRRNALMKKGMVMEVERRKCAVTGHKAIVWGAV